MPYKGKMKILVAYSKSSTYVQTTLDYLLALKRFMNFEVNYIHVTHNAVMDFDINDYDVVFHNYCSRFCFEGYVSKDYERALHRFRGLKIISVQDDYDFTAILHQAIRRMGFHALVSWLPKDCWRLAYPRSEVPGLAIYSAFTGFMPESIAERKVAPIPLRERGIWIGYRGRDIGARYGRLGFDKYEIGRRMIEICRERGVPHDIAMDDASRIYGERWFEFLGSARAMLGVETGSNAFDYDGLIVKEINEFKDRNGRPPRYQEIKPLLDPIESKFDVGQVSARIFECAAMMTPMILYKGRYSDVIRPYEHYIPLEKDFSNIDDVLKRLEDLDELESMARRAYKDLVSSDLYGYRSLAATVDRVISEQYDRVVDQEFVEFRKLTGAPFEHLKVQNPPRNEEEARTFAFLERPTAEPLGLDDLNGRFAQFSQLATAAAVRAAGTVTGKVLAGAPAIADGAGRSLWFRSARAAWRSMPMSVRTRILTVMRSRIGRQ